MLAWIEEGLQLASNLLHQMVHEGLQGDIVCEDGLRCHTPAVTSSGVCGGRVELGQKETCLRTTSIANNETRQWEAISNEFLQYNC